LIDNLRGETHHIIAFKAQGKYMADTRCTLSLIVNGQRWIDAGDALVEQKAIPRRWSLVGLQDYVRLAIGAKLGFTLENIDLVDQRWCRAKATSTDAEAVAAGFNVMNAPHVGPDDSGAGLALEAVESVTFSPCEVVVMVGHSMNWQPLRKKFESSAVAFYELLLPPEGKVVVTTDHVIDLRETARRDHSASPASALLKAAPLNALEIATQADVAAVFDETFAANATRGTVKSLAKGYGVVTRKDGRGDVQFLAAHVQAPGFEFVEVGDELRFDVVQVTSGKWLAQRVVRV
jgi:cold shock CspA family protein